MLSDETASKLILAEYLQLQKTVEDFDAKAVTIKAWSVTIGAAGMVTAYAQSKPMVLIIAAATSLIFWIVEALWKTSQQAFYARIYEIENAMPDRFDSLKPLKIASSWYASWHESKKNKLTLKIMAWPHVFLPHVVVALAGFLLFFVAPPE